MEIVLESKIRLLSRKTEGRTLRVILIISQTVNLISCNKGKKKNLGEAQNNPENIILYYGITLMAFLLYIYIRLAIRKWEGTYMKLSFY